MAEADAEAAILLARSSNRYAAYHCQQAAEKLIKALLLQRGIEGGVEHHLGVLMERLAKDDPWRAKLEPFEAYSPFATAWRHPGSGGRIPAVPEPAVVAADATQITALIQNARTALTSP